MTTRIYDPERSLALAGGRAVIRDQILSGVLAFLDDPATVGMLLDSRQLRRERAVCYEVAHRAVGLAKQAAMPQLEALFRAISDALDANDLAQAERVAQGLPLAIDAVRAAVCEPNGGRP